MAITFVQLLSGTALTLWPGSMQGDTILVTLPQVFSLLPGSAVVALLLKIVGDDLMHYVGPTPGFPTPVWLPAVLAIAGIVSLAAFSAVRGRPSTLAYWTLVFAAASCLLSPLVLLFFGYGSGPFPSLMSVLVLMGLIAALLPLIALAFLIAARHRRTIPNQPT